MLRSPALRAACVLALLAETAAEYGTLGLIEKLFRARWIQRRRARLHTKTGKRFGWLLSALGGVYLELGQRVARILPEAIGSALEPMPDRARPRPIQAVAAVFAKSTGRSIEWCFRTFDPKPMTAASFGQTHDAVLFDGTHVAVKVLDPEAVELAAADLALLRSFAPIANRFVPVAHLDNLASTIEEHVRRESNYLAEARAMNVLRELTTPEVLTMETART